MAAQEIEGRREQAFCWLLPHRRHSYYIVTSQYTRRSAGTKSLHLLCNALNRAGERAFIYTRPYSAPNRAVNGQLLTPLLTRGIVQSDFEAGLTPIVIYPEVVSDNPLRAPFVVRYVLNYPGLLGGGTTYSEDELCVAYSEELAAAVPSARLTLFVPASDPRVFTPEPRVQRSGSCFYAGKYRQNHGGRLFDVTRDSEEIHAVPPQAQTPEEIAGLFRRSEFFYTYENTALAIEALMCECPVVFLPNEHLKQSIGARELGWDGMAWGVDPAELARAKATIKMGRENCLRLFDDFGRALEGFIAVTQQEAGRRKYSETVHADFSRLIESVCAYNEKAALFLYFWRERGSGYAVRRLLRKVVKMVLRGH